MDRRTSEALDRYLTTDPRETGMKTVIIAMPVPDETDIFDLAEEINEHFSPHSDAEECVVYENANALADDLGWEIA